MYEAIQDDNLSAIRVVCNVWVWRGVPVCFMDLELAQGAVCVLSVLIEIQSMRRYARQFMCLLNNLAPQCTPRLLAVCLQLGRPQGPSIMRANAHGNAYMWAHVHAHVHLESGTRIPRVPLRWPPALFYSTMRPPSSVLQSSAFFYLAFLQYNKEERNTTT